jgi:hypothetical protein
VGTTITLKNTVIACLISFLIGALISGIAVYKIYDSKYNTLKTEYNNYKQDTDSIRSDYESKLIDKAVKDNEANKPAKELIENTYAGEISYVPKTSKNDSDVDVSYDVKPILISYNGKQQSLTTSNTESQAKEDNKIVIKQQSQATLDVTDIVNREIANTIDKNKKELQRTMDEDNKKIETLKREKRQNASWTLLGGLALGYILHK